jgi:hypothetical protein
MSPDHPPRMPAAPLIGSPTEGCVLCLAAGVFAGGCRFPAPAASERMSSGSGQALVEDDQEGGMLVSNYKGQAEAPGLARRFPERHRGRVPLQSAWVLGLAARRLGNSGRWWAAWSYLLPMAWCGRLMLEAVASHLVHVVMPSRPTTMACAPNEKPPRPSSLKELTEALTFPFPLHSGQGPGWNVPVP